MKVTILPQRETREVIALDVARLLRELNLRREAVIVVRDDEILTGDVRLAAGDAVEIWPVISGGAR